MQFVWRENKDYLSQFPQPNLFVKFLHTKKHRKLHAELYLDNLRRKGTLRAIINTVDVKGKWISLALVKCFSLKEK